MTPMSTDENGRFQARLSRRAVLRVGIGGALGLGGLSGLHPVTRTPLQADEPSVRGLIVRCPRPLDAESAVEVFDRFLTPNDLFFVRSHFGAPAVGLAPWRLDVNGEVNTPLSFGLDQLKDLEHVTLPAVLQCAGNGRAFFDPKIPGVSWERGAVGNAEWTGVRLADLLRRAGMSKEARHVHLMGADAPPSPKTPAYYRSIPIEKALDPSTLIAYAMNGEPLPVLHGGPLRLIVPTWTGNHWLKWVRRITVSPDEAPGFYMQTAYHLPKEPAPRGQLSRRQTSCR